MEIYRTAALAGNPNVGKSTVFNGLTGLHQHTGNWSGKTVTSAAGAYTYRSRGFAVTDVPGAYSLRAGSGEEEAARDYICSGAADVTVVVCDAGALERNLNLALQILEVTPNVILAVNLTDEAEKRGIHVDCGALSAALGVPVVPMAARRGRGLEELRAAIMDFAPPEYAYTVKYPPELEQAAGELEMYAENALAALPDVRVSARFAALRLLEGDRAALDAAGEGTFDALMSDSALAACLDRALRSLEAAGVAREDIGPRLIEGIFRSSAAICRDCVTGPGEGQSAARRLRVDRVLTGRATGIPIMLAMLAVIFFITVKGANLPSDLLYSFFASLEGPLTALVTSLGLPGPVRDALICGLYRVLSYVVSVMLPPMAIFFPMFTLLEDLGFLPRAAFDLDSSFRRAGACGKQCLTMAMGFGCNAVGVTGCRIIDSRRERLIAVLTNSLVPCNGRFPILIALITMFLVTSGGVWGDILAAGALTGLIVLSVLVTLLVSRILSRTLLRGQPSSPTLELPPFRAPKVGEVIVRSLLDRTVFVLGRAMSVAAPAGVLIWLAANLHIGGTTVLAAITGALDPVGRALGMDGVILTAFILGLPANETVVPIMIMAYAAAGSFRGAEDLTYLRTLLVDNGWTARTAVCTALFTLMHWPCATTLLTVKKETGSLRWTLLAALVPTAAGVIICAATSAVMTWLGG